MRLLVTILCCVILSSNLSFAQKNKNLVIKGKVYTDDGPVVKSLVNVFILDSLILTNRTNDKGEFEIDLPLGYNYILQFNKLKHQSKWVSYETKGVKYNDVYPGFKFKQWEVLLLKDEGITSESETTIKAGRVYFDQESRIFDWDAAGGFIPAELLASKDPQTKETTLNKNLSILDGDIKSGNVSMISEENYPQFTRQVFLYEAENQTFHFSKVAHQWGKVYYFIEKNPITEAEFNRLISGENLTSAQ